MCGVPDRPTFPLQAYHLDGIDQSWLPELTVILCPTDYALTTRAHPERYGWLWGRPQWSYSRGIGAAVTAHAQKNKKSERGGNTTEKKRGENEQSYMPVLLQNASPTG